MRKGKVFVLSLVMASLVVILLSSGVASAGTGNCCVPVDTETDLCLCFEAENQEHCAGTWEEGGLQGIWLGKNKCNTNSNEPCKTTYCTKRGFCVPEMSTIALLATGLICLVGYFRLRREEG